MAGSTDNLVAAVRTMSANSLAHDGKSEEEVATDVEMYWNTVAALHKRGSIGGTFRS